MAREEVEAVLGFSLPNSARNHRPWWSNRPMRCLHRADRRESRWKNIASTSVPARHLGVDQRVLAEMDTVAYRRSTTKWDQNKSNAHFNLWPCCGSEIDSVRHETS